MKKEKKSPAEKAFERSDKHVLEGLKLYPWTPDRIIAAQNAGMLYPKIGAVGRDQIRRTLTYPGCVKDVAIVLYFCTLNDEAVAAADCEPEGAYRDAKKWAVSLGIHRMESAAWTEAFNKFIEIVQEPEDAATVPKGAEVREDDEGSDEGND